MTRKEHTAYYEDLSGVLNRELVGHKVISAGYNRLVLDNGVELILDTENSDCCSFIDLTRTHPVDNIITHVYLDDDEDEKDEYVDSSYKAWITVLTEAGEVNLAEANGNFSNGYYLHGFALGVTVVRPDNDD